ncbi:hypothetical protein [Stenotrophomonas maltophilia]|uniref:hypothetical protein n=1 Tax=Stenotrophomonas maltophilia TaxID=40324 RepID=UPI001FA7CDAF|nr:hypothetical protein [Stenotrophomonas maltophilia]
MSLEAWIALAAFLLSFIVPLWLVRRWRDVEHDRYLCEIARMRLYSIQELVTFRERLLQARRTKLVNRQLAAVTTLINERPRLASILETEQPGKG